MNMAKLICRTFSVAICTLAPLGSLTAAEVSAQEEECSEDALMSFFPTEFVSKALESGNVPKEKWQKITADLQAADKLVVKTIEEKASQMNPNPLIDQSQIYTAFKLFKETLIEVFSSVMKSNGIEDQQQIESMLDEIQDLKRKRFQSCMEKQGGLPK